MFSFSFMCPALLLHHVRFGFSSDELCATPRVLVYLLNLCKFFIWQFRNDFRFRNVPPALWTLSPRWNRAWNVTFPSFLSGSNLLVVPVISIVGGAPVVSSLLFMVAICQSCYSPLSVVAVLVLFFVCVLPLGWLGVIIIVLFFVLRATPWLARGYDYCFVFCLRATPWLVRGYDYCLGFCFTCHPLAG